MLYTVYIVYTGYTVYTQIVMTIRAHAVLISIDRVSWVQIHQKDVSWS